MSHGAADKAREDPQPPDPAKELERVRIVPGVAVIKERDGDRSLELPVVKHIGNVPLPSQQNNARSMEVLGAYWRQGLRELGEALSHQGDSMVHGEYGTLATKPPSMVADGLRGRGSVYGKDDVDVNRETPGPEPEVEPEIDQDLDRDLDMD
ncbi:MAG: hypothetical protein AB7N24_22295 [Dehalococcoidia bacterium]